MSDSYLDKCELVKMLFETYVPAPSTLIIPLKGQQKLTTFSDLVEEGLSYLQLFL